jgi:hypothetical protein
MEGQLLVGLAMDMAPGGFVSAVRPERPPGFEFMTPEQQHAIELANEAAYQSALPEAARWRAAVGERTVESLDTYGDGLLKNGYANTGELQFFVDGSGKIRPIDFTGIKPLPEDHTSPEAVDMIQQHMEHFDSARKHLLEIVEENKRAGRP